MGLDGAGKFSVLLYLLGFWLSRDRCDWCRPPGSGVACLDGPERPGSAAACWPADSVSAAACWPADKISDLYSGVLVFLSASLRSKAIGLFAISLIGSLDFGSTPVLVPKLVEAARFLVLAVLSVCDSLVRSFASFGTFMQPRRTSWPAREGGAFC